MDHLRQILVLKIRHKCAELFQWHACAYINIRISIHLIVWISQNSKKINLEFIYIKFKSNLKFEAGSKFQIVLKLNLCIHIKIT